MSKPQPPNRRPDLKLLVATSNHLHHMKPIVYKLRQPDLKPTATAGFIKRVVVVADVKRESGGSNHRDLFFHMASTPKLCLKRVDCQPLSRRISVSCGGSNDEVVVAV
ncbi:hypothetical protein HanPI659440_Chr17g0674271 [Helianthus annuus]|nr:hypothetical protein HanPI659440_Chr17g0674271 [Helianthus annuus]